jgi:hypothetical protein
VKWVFIKGLFSGGGFFLAKDAGYLRLKIPGRT